MTPLPGVRTCTRISNHTVITALALVCLNATAASTGEQFSLAEVRNIVREWQADGRYVVEDVDPKNPYQVVPSQEGALWLYHYFQNRQPGVRILPTGNPQPQNNTHRSWDNWIAQAEKKDRQRLQKWTESLNAPYHGFRHPPIAEPTRTINPPQSLIQLAGSPPAFAKVIRKQRHTVKFPDHSVTFINDPGVRSRYLFLRNDQGVKFTGSPLSTSTLGTLAAEAGIDNSFLNILQAVSTVEGGFDTVNTYDTGYISIGFLQFASHETGTGSLAQLLKAYKRNNPTQFQSDFRRYGIDVTPTGLLAAVDPTTGKEFIGSAAVHKITQDKRLTAVFQRAGKISRDFQKEQLLLAKTNYDPRFQPFTAFIDGTAQNFTVDQIFKSEAGLATVMDRLVNTGSTIDVGLAVASVSREFGAKSATELQQYEDAIVRQLTYRTDFLAVNSLSKPPSSGTLVAANLNTTRRSVPAPSSMRGSLSGGGNEPLQVIPGVNVALSPRGNPVDSQNPGDATEVSGPVNTEPKTRVKPPVKPDSQVGRPITDIGS